MCRSLFGGGRSRKRRGWLAGWLVARCPSGSVQRRRTILELVAGCTRRRVQPCLFHRPRLSLPRWGIHIPWRRAPRTKEKTMALPLSSAGCAAATRIGAVAGPVSQLSFATFVSLPDTVYRVPADLAPSPRFGPCLFSDFFFFFRAFHGLFVRRRRCCARFLVRNFGGKVSCVRAESLHHHPIRESAANRAAMSAVVYTLLD